MPSYLDKLKEIYNLTNYYNNWFNNSESNYVNFPSKFRDRGIKLNFI